MKKQLAIAGSLAILAGAAFAGDDTTEQSFKDLDTNKDGVLTQDEAAMDDALIVQFVEIDTNRDGILSISEYIDGTEETEEGE
jgi:hypothetical protein